MKQKSLMAFFNKPAPATPSAKTKENDVRKAAQTSEPSTARKSRVNDAPSSDNVEVHTPSSKSLSQRSRAVSPHGTRSSAVPSSPMETPPTSDPIDIDMLSDEPEKPSKGKEVTKAVRFCDQPEPLCCCLTVLYLLDIKNQEAQDCRRRL